MGWLTCSAAMATSASRLPRLASSLRTVLKRPSRSEPSLASTWDPASASTSATSAMVDIADGFRLTTRTSEAFRTLQNLSAYLDQLTWSIYLSLNVQVDNFWQISWHRIYNIYQNPNTFVLLQFLRHFFVRLNLLCNLHTFYFYFFLLEVQSNLGELSEVWSTLQYVNSVDLGINLFSF